jgi:hypothetical protein
MIEKNQNPDAETGTTTALENLLKEANSLNEKIEQAIIKVVKENGGLVRTDTTENSIPICGYVFNEESGHYEEWKILALTTFEDNALSILIGEDYEILGDMTNDKILESSEWYGVTEGLVFAAPTLACICEFLEEYI